MIDPRTLRYTKPLDQLPPGFIVGLRFDLYNISQYLRQ